MHAHMLTTPGKNQAPPETPALFAHWGWVEGTFKALRIRRERYSAIQIKYKLTGRKQVAKWTSNCPFTSVALLWIRLYPELLNSYWWDGGYKDTGVWSFRPSRWQPDRAHEPLPVIRKPGLGKGKVEIFVILIYSWLRLGAILRTQKSPRAAVRMRTIKC